MASPAESVSIEPGDEGVPDFGEHVLGRAPGALPDAERVVGLRDAVKLGPGPEPVQEREQQVLPRERVAGALDEQHRRADPRQVRLAPLLELPRRMQRVAEEREAVGAVPRRHDLRRDPPAHRAAAVDDSLGPRRRQREAADLPGRRFEHGGRVGPAQALRGVGEVVEKRGATGAGEGVGEGDEHRVAAVAPGPVAENDHRAPPAVERGGRPGAGHPQLLHVGGSIPERPAGRGGWYTRRASKRAGFPTVYESWYGFREKPFNLTPDPKYLYLSQRHAEAFAHLEFGRRERGGFILITGEVGTGKTTLARYFLSKLGPDTHTAFVLYPALTADELLRTILDDLHVKPEGDSQEEPRGRAPPLPARGPGGEPQRRAAHRRGAGPLGGGAGADPPHLEPRDRHREAHPDRPHGPVGAARHAGPARAAAARPEGDRALPPLAPVAGRDRRVRPAPHRRGGRRGQGGLHERRPRHRPSLFERRPPARQPGLRPGAPRRVRPGLANDHRRHGAAGGATRWRRPGRYRPSAGTTGSSRPGSPWPSPFSPSPSPRASPRRPRPPSRTPPP